MPDSTKQFNVFDLMGNARVKIAVKNNTVLSVQAFNYKPFGDTVNCSDVDRVGFIGKELDEENNYFLFGVRNYDKETGRFLQVDPLFEMFSNYNPYHYCYNNPISYKDPTGFAPGKEDNELQGKVKRDERLQVVTIQYLTVLFDNWFRTYRQEIDSEQDSDTHPSLTTSTLVKEGHIDNLLKDLFFDYLGYGGGGAGAGNGNGNGDGNSEGINAPSGFSSGCSGTGSAGGNGNSTNRGKVNSDNGITSIYVYNQANFSTESVYDNVEGITPYDLATNGVTDAGNVNYDLAFLSKSLNGISFDCLLANYPKNPDNSSQDMASDEVYNLIGGKVLENHINDPDSYKNACALRVSRALNYCNFKIPYIKGQTLSGDDGLNYFFRAADLCTFLTKFKNPIIKLNDIKGKRGIFIMQAAKPGEFGAWGHATLYNINNCMSQKCYIGEFAWKYYFWEL